MTRRKYVAIRQLEQQIFTAADHPNANCFRMPPRLNIWDEQRLKRCQWMYSLTVLVREVDQPYIQAATVPDGKGVRGRRRSGENDFNHQTQSATMDVSGKQATASVFIKNRVVDVPPGSWRGRTLDPSGDFIRTVQCRCILRRVAGRRIAIFAMTWFVVRADKLAASNPASQPYRFRMTVLWETRVAQNRLIRF